MKNKIFKYFLILILAILLFFYIRGFEFWGAKDEIVVNKPQSQVLKNRPKLNDDFYDYVNYDYLSEDKLGEDVVTYFSMNQDKIDDEKKVVIEELLAKESTISKKMNILKKSYENNKSDESKNTLNKYIEKMNNSKSIEEFFENAIEINYDLSIDILVSPAISCNPRIVSKKYFGFTQITYDFDNPIGYYSIDECDDFVRMYKKYDIQLLKAYGYSEQEAIRITNNTQKMYKEISKFSSIDEESMYENGYKIYSKDDLQQQLQNIKIDKIIENYKKIYNGKDELIVDDINQLKLIDKYLKEDNLEILKDYATLKIITKYSQYISDETFKIYQNYQKEANQIFDDEEITKEDILNEILYYYFKDTVIEEFAGKHFSKKQKEFYTSLIKQEIDVYKERIKEAEWLGEDTKQKALAKMENITYTVGVPDNFVKIEKDYEINENNTYIDNIIDMNKKINNEMMNQYQKDNIDYYNEEMDALTLNAYYMPSTNSINLLLGYIYSLTETLEYSEDLEESYYEILGSLGVVIGHELSHALDTMGSKYDEKGDYINWWNDDDAYNFNILTSKVMRYYDNFEQYGDTTLGENIADLGGMTIALEIAEKKNATIDDYKLLFQSHAKNFAIQETSLVREFLLKNDEHSPNKNRVNALLSNFEKFYEVYNIETEDGMFVPEEDRVSVW